jgi:hypothetical protein
MEIVNANQVQFCLLITQFPNLQAGLSTSYNQIHMLHNSSPSTAWQQRGASYILCQCH